MSRSGYSDDWGDCDYYYNINPYYGAIASACRGKRGQQFFKDLLAALDEIPQKRLIAELLVENGEFCALGVLGAKRGLPLENIDPEDARSVAKYFDIAETLAREVVYENDEGYRHYGDETPEHRFIRMRKWVVSQIIPPLMEGNK